MSACAERFRPCSLSPLIVTHRYVDSDSRTTTARRTPPWSPRRTPRTTLRSSVSLTTWWCRNWAGTRTPTTSMRSAIEEVIGGELLDEESDEVIDVVLLWWRDGDGDLVDALMDAISPLADDGFVWVLTPKTGPSGHVEPSEIAESAPTAGLTQTSAANLGDWIGSRLVQPKTGRPSADPAFSRTRRRTSVPHGDRSGHRGARFHPQGSEQPGSHALGLPGQEERPARLLPARVHRACARASCARCATTCRSSRTTTPRSSRSRSARRPRTRSGRPSRDTLFPLLSDFWPHGEVAQAYGVFNDKFGFANRGTFVIDKDGIVRFAEENGPGEPRDQGAWDRALAALES